MEVVGEQLVTDSEAKDILEAVEKEREPKFAQKNSLGVLRKFVGKEANGIKELVTELKKIEKLRERHIVAIANFLPADKDDLRAVLHKDYSLFSEDEINLVLETVKKIA